MAISKRKTLKKEAPETEEIETKTSGFALKPFLLTAGIVIVLGCVAAYSLREPPVKKHQPLPLPPMEEKVSIEKEDIHIPPCDCPTDKLKEQIAHLEETNVMLRKALSQQADKVEDLKRIEEKKDREMLLSKQLLEALYAGRPFKIQWEALEKFNPSAPLLKEISTLKDNAPKGIPTFEKVRKSFFDAYPLTEKSFYIKRGSRGSWTDRVSVFVKMLVRVRPQKISGKNATGILLLYQAEDFIKEGNIERALETVEKLPFSQKSFMYSFIKDASAYLELKKCFE